MEYEIICACDAEKLPVITRTPKNTFTYYPNNISLVKLCQSCAKDTFEVILSEYGNYFSNEEVPYEM